jgi:hypothetical protein
VFLKPIQSILNIGHFAQWAKVLFKDRAEDIQLNNAYCIVRLTGKVELKMVKLSKNQLKKETVATSVKQEKQSTLDDISFQFNIEKTREEITPKKAIVINKISDTTKEDELSLKVEFNLLPSKTSFSKINLDLFFQEQLINSTTVSIPQSTLLNDTSEFPLILDMKGIVAGEYQIRVEMYEPWSSGEKLNFTFKEITVQYIPQNREARYVKIPTVRSVAGSDLTIVSSCAKNIYREIEQDQKQEAINKRDEW